MENEKKTSIWKKIGIGLAAFFTGIIACLLGGHSRRKHRDQTERAEQVRGDTESAKQLNQSARDEVESARQTVDELRDDSGSLRQNVEECQSIIQHVRERNKKK